MKLISLVLLFFLVPSARAEDCVHQASGILPQFFESFTGWLEKTSVKFDASLLTDWRHGQPLPCAEPFLATFQKNGMELRFLAVRHVNPPIKIEGSDLAILEKEVKAFGPKHLVLEMGSFPNAFIPAEEAVSMAQGCRQEIQYLCSETQFLLELAGRNHIGVFAGEPDGPKLFSGLNRNFSLEEIYAFESTRTMWTLKLDPAIAPHERPQEFMKLLRQSISDQRGSWSYENYEAWLRKHLGPGFSPEKADIGWLEPRSDPDATALNRISHAADKIRDASVLASIESSLNESGRTMAIYGSSHFIREREALEQVLGPAKIRCLR